MNMALVNGIRTLGWPDLNGDYQYGNAAVLCYLAYRDTRIKRFVEQHKDMLVKDLIAKSA